MLSLRGTWADTSLPLPRGCGGMRFWKALSQRRHLVNAWFCNQQKPTVTRGPEDREGWENPGGKAPHGVFSKYHNCASGPVFNFTTASQLKLNTRLANPYAFFLYSPNPNLATQYHHHNIIILKPLLLLSLASL